MRNQRQRGRIKGSNQREHLTTPPNTRAGPQRAAEPVPEHAAAAGLPPAAAADGVRLAAARASRAKGKEWAIPGF